ncbi:MAG TPA: DUF692 family protein [Nitrospiraceae bacterium]|nr:DUF692 family protein [Nitrospiraceae bacterium]
MSMTSIEQEFQARVARIPRQGLGLSVDVYTPDLFEVTEMLDGRGLPFGYLEIFKASKAVLEDVQDRLPHGRLQYHAEGLWVTQPQLEGSVQFDIALATAAEQAATLGSAWMNHECAAKQIAGYSFGTYLPPLFTNASADVVAENATLIQQRLAASGSFTAGREPLLLIEIPPLTYFGFGDLSVAEFFRRVVAQTPCGLVLDIGHVWTVYRYTAEWRRRGGVLEFLAEFLEVFPLERVVQIHLAGLETHGVHVEHARRMSRGADEPPRWIDAHSAPIPEVLWEMLAQVLAHPRLCHLKGVALEVDTKAVPLIITEFERFQSQFGEQFHAEQASLDREKDVAGVMENIQAARHDLAQQYERYARLVSMPWHDSPALELPLLGSSAEELDQYRGQYLPHEILEWGGSLREMFPETCRRLDDHGIALTDFLTYWFREPRPADSDYDFFVLKLEWFVAFVKEMLPDATETAEREANALRNGYQAACESANVLL